MATEIPKVEFALGSEVSSGRFFKSAFARNFISSSRDCKSLDYELLDNAVAAVAANAEDEDRNNNGRNNNFFSLVNFTDGRPASGDNAAAATTQVAALWEQSKPKEAQPATDANELEKLRKQCQLLKKENRRLQSGFLQNVFLQARVDTLQWQVKQVESNRQMYRSTMEQVAHFLGRARRSLDILHATENAKDKRRVPRSRSVHTVVHVDPSPSRGTATPSSISSSPFTRAKSVTQIGSPGATCFREFTWSVLRRNDPVHCTSPRTKPPQDRSKTSDVANADNVVYREPKQSELNPDEIPPEKLSQEAFRLLRTVESLLSMREPDLARVTPLEDNGSCPSPIPDHHRHHDLSLSLPSGNFANSTTLQEATAYAGCSGRGNESGNGRPSDSRSPSLVKPSAAELARNLQAFVPGVRRSPDTASWNSSSSKTTEEEDAIALAASSSNGATSTGTPTSTLGRVAKRLEKREEKLGKTKVKPASSPVSSAGEGESGFFSISSFQEIGLPSSALPITPIKGCHTEVGLPEVPLDKARHRRWSSTPAEIQALFKQHRASFGGTPQTTGESVSVCWV